MTTEPRMVLHLKPAFGPQVLRSIARDQMQAFLDKKAETLSRSIVDHLRWDLNNVFKTALADGLVDSNPAAALFTPACKPEGEKRVMSPEEIRVALGVLRPRERLIFRMAVFDGMRPGEILATSTVHDLVALSGVAFEERDAIALPFSGVSREWRLFAVVR